jgi:LTXXQ motif family protein
MMKSRLEAMQAVKPTLLALYDKLSPDQKAVFDRPMMGRGMGRYRHHRRG